MSENEINLNKLNGIEKAAVFLMSVGEDNAARLMEQLDDHEIKEISQAMSSLGVVNADLVERVFMEFMDQVSGAGSMMGTYDSTERLLSRVLGNDRVTEIMEDIRGPAGKTMWDKLSNVNEETLANYLRNEYPQTIAVVLSKIKPDNAGRVLAALPDELSSEVIGRMLKMENVQKEILSDVERTLRTEFMSNLAKTSSRDPYEMIADIFNSLDRDTEERFMQHLENEEDNAAERVRALMFTFEDLARLDATSIQILLRNMDKAKLPIALKGTSEDLKDLFFSNMSERAAKILRDDMENMGPVRLKDVEEAQYYAVQLAKDLAERGEIIISQGPEDKMVV